MARAIIVWILVAATTWKCQESPRGAPDEWQRVSARRSGVDLVVPATATVRDFDSAVLVFIRPISKPFFDDWQYAVEIRIEKVSRQEFAARTRQKSNDGSTAAWMVSEHLGLSTTRLVNETLYRLDRPCSDSVLSAFATIKDADGYVSSEDSVVRRILQSAACGQRSQ